MNDNIKVIKNSIQPGAFEDCPIEIYSFKSENYIIYVERDPRTSEIKIYAEYECVKEYKPGEAILNLAKDNLKSIEVKKHGVEYLIQASNFKHCLLDAETISPEIKQIIKDMIECRETEAREDNNKEQGNLSNEQPQMDCSNLPNANQQLRSQAFTEVSNNESSLSDKTLTSNQITSVSINSPNDKSKTQAGGGISK